MHKTKINLIALFTVTLFLFAGVSSIVFGQQNHNSKNEAQVQKYEINLDRSPFHNLKSQAQPKFFPAKTANNALPNAAKQTVNYTRPNADERFKKYLSRTFGPYALLGDVASAGFAQITDSPEEWENNSKGFGRRLASTVGKSIIKETTIYGLDEVLKLDSSFYKSGSRKFNERLKNAVLSTFTARKLDGKRVVGIPRLVGTYASSIIAAETWYPARYDYKDGLRSGTISLGVNVGINFIKEIFQK